MEKKSERQNRNKDKGNKQKKVINMIDIYQHINNHFESQRLNAPIKRKGLPKWIK